MGGPASIPQELECVKILFVQSVTLGLCMGHMGPVLVDTYYGDLRELNGAEHLVVRVSG